MKVKAFTNEYIEEAVNIFTNNYRMLREDYNELPSKYEDKDVITPLLKEIVAHNPSAVALDKDRILGYMTGFADRKEFKGKATGVYIPEWGHSVIGNTSKEKVYHELYRYLSNEWVTMKNYTHCITFYANDGLLKELFYNLCFGLLVIDGLKPIGTIDTRTPEDIQIREATLDDMAGIKKLHEDINTHLSEAPIFLYRSGARPSLEELKDDFLNEGVKTFIAERQGEIVSCIRALIDKGPNVRIVQDEGTLGVNFGYTYPNMRGLGLGTHVLNELTNWGINNGMKRCTVDFESQNREGARFWLRHFKPICYSAIRKVDDRV